MSNQEFKQTSKVTYVYVFGFINNNSQLDFIGYIEVPYTYNDFVAFSKEQRIHIGTHKANTIATHFLFPDKWTA